jgi:hypothetical protein
MQKEDFINKLQWDYICFLMNQSVKNFRLIEEKKEQNREPADLTRVVRDIII